MLSEDSRRGKQSLVNKPFSNCVKISRVLSSHSKLVYHRDAAQAADVSKSSVHNPGTRIDVMTSPVLQAQIGQNEHILQGIYGQSFSLQSRVYHSGETLKMWRLRKILVTFWP